MDKSAIDRFESACKADFKEPVFAYYSQWAENYDSDSLTADYNGPEITCRYANEFISDKNAKIIDICAGTGAGAKQMRKYGFSNLDALDGAAEMLEIAKENNLYQRYFCTFLNPGEETDISEAEYNGLICIGSFLGGHLKPEVADEFLRILKPEGIAVIGMREAWLREVEEYKDKLEPYLLNLKGWKLLKRDLVPKWFGDLEGIIWVFQKL